MHAILRQRQQVAGVQKAYLRSFLENVFVGWLVLFE
jgi:hypothetical protein